MTNKGLRLNVNLAKGPGGGYILSLNCSRREQPEQTVGIYLRQSGASLYAREKPQELAAIVEWVDESYGNPIYISKNIMNQFISATVDGARRHAIRCRHGFENGEFSYAAPTSLWDGHNNLYLTKGSPSFAGIFYFQPDHSSGPLMIACALPDSSPPWVTFLNPMKMPEIGPALSNPSRIFQLPNCTMMDRVILYDDPTWPKRFSLSISLEEGTGDREPMYCINLHQHKTKPGSLPSQVDYIKQLKAP